MKKIYKLITYISNRYAAIDAVTELDLHTILIAKTKKSYLFDIFKQSIASLI